MRGFSMRKLIASFALFVLVFVVGASAVIAQGADEAILKSKNTEEKFNTVSREAGGLFQGVTVACWGEGSCTLCDGLIVFINVANGILRLLAIVAVLYFVYGAALLVLSQGNEDLVSRGKGALKATIVGTVIVLVAWQVMALVVFFLASNSITNGARNQTPELKRILEWYNVANICNPELKE
jgi:hypothetical protein